jgi:hypothetical protein
MVYMDDTTKSITMGRQDVINLLPRDCAVGGNDAATLGTS